ncbi:MULTISPECIES: type I-C CRISPR-associated protein Cas7/Csd2 [Dethiosulfovibrio]|uniref:Type I-C CRISPR-associated protein Cas7/Csd2 n=2 Tax=Dethiosulfovibrio TaxID=47054 RepID=A0ABS9ERG2_9BACT|nr:MULTISPECIES: type I-C CRISPR-associated protein Cas7/Csd2 [Dethiosulfovibrio]MCF4114877.1 type I-C CRISPR-associated protein Cas7/Csd2 [Dethiosulfovibrio russensis]MCF4142398.1 type I-C CRISPR-associated protein Cas7/Csd2 [Dethiosulfovibrio marinus]MCF4145369.1 type I-C CRISPR-associated protein Cas7/Csd2 [Dethiosulfovibrio acidaminovorans]
MSLSKKIDFALIFSVDRANPNGDPLNGNRPRIDYEGYGEVSDVCLKRKIRDRLLEDGHSIFVQSDQNRVDSMPSLRKRAESEEFGLGKDAFDSKKTKAEDLAKKACEKWLDVRTFGQLFAFGSDTKNGVSIPIRGPMTIQSAFSVEPVSVASIQITKSVSGDGDGSKRGSDTMGMKHRVDHGIYVTYGAISPQLAERTGFSDGDAEVIKRVLPKIFEGDASSARPEGSMSVIKVLWWEHSSKMGNFSSAKVHGTLTVNPDGSYEVDFLEGISLEEIDGF